MPVTASNGFDLLRKKDGGAQANQVCLKMGYTPTWLSKWGKGDEPWDVGVLNFQTDPYMYFS